MGKLTTRIKTWWKTATTAEKLNTILGIAGVGGAMVCARKIDHAFDKMQVTLTLRGQDKLWDLIEAKAVQVQTPTLGFHDTLVKGNRDPLTPEEIEQYKKDCGEE